MGLFAGGVMLDNRTRYSRAVTGATLRAVDPVTGEALATFSAEFPDNPKTVTTNGNGAYEDFIVPAYDVIRLEASGVSQSMVSQEVLAGKARSLAQPVATSADLPAVERDGSLRITEDDLHLWVWDDELPGWTDLGSLRGEDGLGASDEDIASQVSTEGTQTRDAVQTLADNRAVVVTEGRYRRVLHEARALGPTDDLAPLLNTAAAEASGTDSAELVLPEGSYRLVAASQLTVPNVTIRAAGPDKTLLQIVGDHDGIKVAGTQASPVRGVQLSGFTIAGSGADVAHGNQRGIFLQWAPGFRVSDVKIQGAANNGLNAFQCDGGTISDLDVSQCRDFGVLIFQSVDVRAVDIYAHDIGVAGRANQGIQLKNCRNVWAVRPIVRRVQGYGLMTRTDPAESGPLNSGAGIDEDNAFIDAMVSDTLAGGAFSATSLFLESTQRCMVRGGVFRDSALGHLAIANSPHARVSGVAMRNAVSAGVSLSGASTVGYRLFDTHVEAAQQGFVFTGVGWGSLRASSGINCTGTGSSLNAGCRVTQGTRGLHVTDSDFSDYQATKTQRRGIFEEVGTGTPTGNNRVENCTAYGNTASDIVVLTAGTPPSLSRNNGTTAAPLA